MKKFFAILLIFVISLPSFSYANDYDGYVSFICERTTIGQGLVVEPVKVGFYKNEVLATVIERALGDKSTYKGPINSYYLSSIKDGGEPAGWTTKSIPKDIANVLEEVYEREDKSYLGEFDYSDYAGWMFFVDNKCSSVGAGAIKYSPDFSADGNTYTDGSVIRLMFTTYGYGRDLGIDWGIFEFETANTFPNRDGLIVKASECTNKHSEAYKRALNVLTNWLVTEADISNALALFNDNSYVQYDINFDDRVTLKASLNNYSNSAYAFLVETDMDGNILNIEVGELGSDTTQISMTYNADNLYKSIFVDAATFAPLN